MRIDLKRYADGRLRPSWYGEFRTQGKRRVVTLCDWRGSPPASGTLSDLGDDEFEKSRRDALAMLQDLTHTQRSKADKETLVQRIHAARYGSKVKVVPLNSLTQKWDEFPRRRTPGTFHRKNRHRIIQRFISHMHRIDPTVKELGAVTEDHMRSFMRAEEERGISPRTWNVGLFVMKELFRRLEPFSEAWLSYLAITPTKEGRSIHREPFSPEEIKAVLDAAAEDKFLYPLVVTALCTAMRRGDICTLRWKHIDLNGGFITVKTAKTGETVEIPILPMLRDLLLTIRPAGTANPDDFVFPAAAKVHANNSETLDRRLKIALKQAGFIDPSDVERLRHETTRRSSLAELTPEETLRRGMESIKSTHMTSPRRNRMVAIFTRYMAGKTVNEIAEELASSKGIVSTRLNDIESMIGAVVVRRSPLPAVIRGSTLAEISGSTPRMKRGSLKGWHSFRTTWITLALSAGVPMELVRRVTGHASADIVLKHYFRPGREAFRAALYQAMPGLLLGGGPPPSGQDTGGPKMPSNSTRPVDRAALPTKRSASKAQAADATSALNRTKGHNVSPRCCATLGHPEPAEADGEFTTHGMDLRTPEARARWDQLLGWLHAQVTRDFPYIVPGAGICPEDWGPRNRQEHEEVDLLRAVLLAQRAETVEATLSDLTLEQVFRIEEADSEEANRFADLMEDYNTHRKTPPPLMEVDLKLSLYAWKRNACRNDKIRNALSILGELQRSPRGEVLNVWAYPEPLDEATRTTLKATVSSESYTRAIERNALTNKINEAPSVSEDCDSVTYRGHTYSMPTNATELLRWHKDNRKARKHIPMSELRVQLHLPKRCGALSKVITDADLRQALFIKVAVTKETYALRRNVRFL